MKTRIGNCLIWVVKQRITVGGRITWRKSKTWWGWHNTWIDPNGDEWEFTLVKPKRQPWWYIPIWYTGEVKKIKK